MNLFARSSDKERLTVIACTQDRCSQVGFSEHGPEVSTRETTALPRLLHVKGPFANILLCRGLTEQRCICSKDFSFSF
ncbi:hypothetical protein BDA96_07G065600 [Sorghum bicolor]|uniref:Uncharacterized protein n=2 Tax=Sorghum bicolor TaxID=4558 RepID=A0A921U8J1_SORBI|nr:hypothetical protein BDA96_07G065600 [Sorghum bicolor]KXG24587.1 hypothetical protein SORBI_3007G062900 [Sorghum bicolor]